jgi:hypothetical protein
MGHLFSSIASIVHLSHTSGPPFSASVREEAWANDIFIGSSQLGCGCAWTTTKWYGDFISPDFYNRIYIHTGSVSSIVAVETDAGFFGFSPDNINDGYYLLPVNVSARSVQYGFSPVQAVPEPGTWAMILAGLGMLILRQRGRIESNDSLRWASLHRRRS